jgi:hypothetical protein
VEQAVFKGADLSDIEHDESFLEPVHNDLTAVCERSADGCCCLIGTLAGYSEKLSLCKPAAVELGHLQQGAQLHECAAAGLRFPKLQP